MIYLDHNASTPLDPRVLEAMLPYLQHLYANPSALYKLGRAARSSIDSAREQVASLVSVSPDQVFFTSGGTEANNWALCQIASEATLTLSSIEHPSLLQAALQKQHIKLQKAPVDNQGCLDVRFLQSLACQEGDLVSLQLANNETGVIQNFSHFTQNYRSQGALVHTDATQAAGKITVDFSQLQVDLLTLSSHKIYGPKGCGALIAGKNVKLTPFIAGGGQEANLRAGTENVAAIVGFGKAAELARQELQQRQKHLASLSDHLERSLKAISGVTIFSETAIRLPNTLQFGIIGFDGEMLLMQLDKHNIAVSSGSACASGGGKPSNTLSAMGIDAVLAKSAIRISLGQNNTFEEIEHFLKVLGELLSPI